MKNKPHGDERLRALREGLLGVKKGVDRKLDEVSERAYEEACEENPYWRDYSIIFGPGSE